MKNRTLRITSYCAALAACTQLAGNAAVAVQSCPHAGTAPALHPHALSPLDWLVELIGIDTVAGLLLGYGLALVVSGIIYRGKYGHWPWWFPLNRILGRFAP